MTGPIEIDPAGLVQSAEAHIDTVEAPTMTGGTSSYVRIMPDLSSLPDELKSEDGTSLRLGNTLAVVWQLLHSLEIRTITGRVLLDSAPGGIGGQVWQAGQSAELPMVWDEPAPIVPTGLLVSAEASIVNAAKVAARLKPGTLTTTGCVVIVQNISNTSVVVNAVQPVLVRGQALYLYTPPLISS